MDVDRKDLFDTCETHLVLERMTMLWTHLSIADGLLAMKPEGLRERGVIWLNGGGPNPSFTPVVLHEGRPGWHNAALGDVDGDGDVDIVSKVWNADGPNYHVDSWRNDTCPA